MRVLVTGSAGFIGQAVKAVLLEAGHVIAPFDRPDHDVLDPSGLFEACREADAVINLAGRLGTPELFGAEYAAAEVNILGALNVYDAAAEADIPVVQIGTGHKGQPNPYAITKGCAEDLALARAQWLGDKIAVVRAFHVYGPGQLPGPPHGPAPVHKFFPTFACQALTGKSLELCGGGWQLIDPVHVSDVAQVLASAIDGPYGEVLEAGCGKPISVRHIAHDIADIALTDPWPDVMLSDGPPRLGEPPDAEVVASRPLCTGKWPYLVPETISWYRDYLGWHGRT